MTAVITLLIVAAIIALAFPKIKTFVKRSRAKRIDEAARLKAPMAEYDKRHKAIMALSLGKARKQAESLLTDPLKFKCTSADIGPDSRLDILAPELQSIFQRYEMIEAVGSDHILNRNIIKQLHVEIKSPHQSLPLWIIGLEDGGHYAVAVRSGQEEIFVTDGLDHIEDMDKAEYPSIYHWLLAVSINVYE